MIIRAGLASDRIQEGSQIRITFTLSGVPVTDQREGILWNTAAFQTTVSWAVESLLW